MKVWILTVLIVLGSLVVAAQTPQNPVGAAFDASPDHAQVTRYEYGIFLLGAAAPMSTVSLGKPTPDTTNTIAFTLNTAPLGMGQYELKARSVVVTTAVPPVTMLSAWVGGGPTGALVVPFDIAVRPPSNLRLR